MRVRPVHIWWIGVALFTPSVLIWMTTTSISLSEGVFYDSFDWRGITRIYLPMLAAFLGFIIPVGCLRLLRSSAWTVNALLFGGYLALLLAWGIIDIRHSHWQTRMKNYSEGGETSLTYYTWYFMPYKWIE